MRGGLIDCNNCALTHGVPHDEPCMISVMGALALAEKDMEDTEVLELMENVNIDAFWEDFGPILSRFREGRYSYVKGE